jgi:hypothetical protein
MVDFEESVGDEEYVNYEEEKVSWPLMLNYK